MPLTSKALVREFDSTGGGAVSETWVDITQLGGGGGPHTHGQEDVTGLEAALAGKAAIAHNHDAAYAPLVHTHSYEPANANIQSHIASTSNPHSVTKSQVGLANVDNTSDANKPISAATQTALDGKEPANANIQAHVASAHAPANAQKNSDILKSEIEAVLTGVISSHSHAGGGSVPWTLVNRTADSAGRVNSTLADDGVLQFATVANTQYIAKLRVWFITNATADFKYRLVHTGTTTRVSRRPIRYPGGAAGTLPACVAAFDAADVPLAGTGNNGYIEEYLVLQVGASGGLVKFQWAQNTTNAGAAIVLEGSHFEHTTT